MHTKQARLLRFPAWLALLAGVVLTGDWAVGPAQPARAAEPAAVTLQVVKLKELKEAVAAQRGKVVLIDLWGEY